ncbi:MAG: flagellar biosynthesis anti-sigma factor FlgM [Clostridiaceae bacterium]|jgi:negative regulator of flagellin synthesis FlgM|nr:flagellar biosynthesis anti-sigma factor FlgM [Clostridiaceae bacterium]
MRIPGDISKITGVYGSQKNIGRVGRTGAVASKKDVLSISSEAKDFQTVYRALKEVPDIRADKVRSLETSIGSGTYSVKGRDVADKVIKGGFDIKG